EALQSQRPEHRDHLQRVRGHGYRVTGRDRREARRAGAPRRGRHRRRRPHDERPGARDGGSPGAPRRGADLPRRRVRRDPLEATTAGRVDLAAGCRLVAHYGWEDRVFTHIAARVPSTEDQFLINPCGLFFDEITASSLVRIDVHGNSIQDSPYPVNPAGFVNHSAIHAARHDAKCVLHTHTLNGVAVSAQRAGLLPISQHSISVLTSLGYHDFEGPALRDDEKPRLVADLGDRTSLILRNHGLLTVGETVADACVAMYYLETCCAIQVRAQSGG